MATLCPECDNPLDIDQDEMEEGDTVTCDEDDDYPSRGSDEDDDE